MNDVTTRCLIEAVDYAMANAPDNLTKTLLVTALNEVKSQGISIEY